MANGSLWAAVRRGRDRNIISQPARPTNDRASAFSAAATNVATPKWSAPMRRGRCPLRTRQRARHKHTRHASTGAGSLTPRALALRLAARRAAGHPGSPAGVEAFQVRTLREADGMVQRVAGALDLAEGAASLRCRMQHTRKEILCAHPA